MQRTYRQIESRDLCLPKQSNQTPQLRTATTQLAACRQHTSVLLRDGIMVDDEIDSLCKIGDGV